MYLATKLPRPHYSPEICIKLTLLNFMTTEEGLLDQLLSDIVKVEHPHIDKMRQRCIEESADCNRKLKITEDNILDLISNSEGNILENEELINEL